MHHLGIASTRALSLIAGDDPVRRETIERAAVICRVAPSHVRFGNFEVFYYRGQTESLAPLADHRSAERRVGKECVSTCRSRWAPAHKQKNKTLLIHNPQTLS